MTLVASTRRASASRRWHRLRGAAGWALALVLISTLGCEAPPAETVSRPNVVLVSIDTLRPDHLEIYGYGRETAPHLRQFAASGVVFENAMAHSPKTAPSHMTLLTSRHPGAHGVRNLQGRRGQAVSPSIPLMAEILARADYATAGFTGGGHLTATLGFDRGFETFVPRGEPFLKAREWVENLPADPGPFFLFVHTYSIHDPYLAPERFQIFNSADYAGEIVGDRQQLEQLAGEDWKRQHSIYWERVDTDSPADLGRLQALYDAAIRLTDTRLRSLLTILEEHDLLDGSLVLVVSDHGEEFQEHGGFLHNSLYQENLRVPLVLKMPGAGGAELAGRRIDSTVRLIDVLPTVLEALGLEAPPLLQGRSLMPLLDGTGENGPPEVLSEWPGAGFRALQQGNWKLIVGPEGEEELYDLAADPTESRNLLGAEPEEARRLRDLMSRWADDNSRLLGEATSGKEQSLTPDVRKQLEALGYLD